MCGIVGVAGNLSQTDVTIFDEMLLADVVRGVHSTGVAMYRRGGQVDVTKLAVPSYHFLDMGWVKARLTGRTMCPVVLGHNRHATKGNSGDTQNAHPFQHGHITLVHNGTLDSHYNLTPTGETFTVDSEAICRGIEVSGIEEIGPKLRGAFALVWIDNKENTLNFFRNSKRRLGLLFNTKENKVWWSSEIELAKWALARGEDLYSRSVTEWDKELELPVGKWISIPITQTGISLVDMEVKEIDISQSVSRSYGTHGASPRKYQSSSQAPSYNNTSLISLPTTGDYQYELHPTSESSAQKSTASIVENRGKTTPAVRALVSTVDVDPSSDLMLDERLPFWVQSFEPYATSDTFGKIVGTLAVAPYCDVELPSMGKHEYEYFKKNSESGMLSAYVGGFIVPLKEEYKMENGYITEGINKFGLIMNKSTVRHGDPSIFCCEEKETTPIEKKPEAQEKETSPPFEIEETLAFELQDKTMSAPGGSVLFKGVIPPLVPGYRYHVAYANTDNSTHNVLNIGLVVGDNTYNVPYSACYSGSTKPEVMVPGPKGQITLQDWRRLVKDGCSHCSEIPNDVRIAEGIEWADDKTFICAPCVSEFKNRGY